MSEEGHTWITSLSYARMQEKMPQIMEVEANVFEVHGALYDITPWQENNFLNQLPNKEIFSAFLTLDGEVKGFSIAYEFQPSYCHISRVAMHTDMAGKGLGRLMLKSQLNSMKAKGIVICSIDLIIENTTAFDFYTKLGFKRLTEEALEEYVTLKGREASEYLGVTPSHMAMTLSF